MRQTLFHIPPEFLGLPVFGWGWALILWTLFSIGLLIYLFRRRGGDSELWSQLPVLVVVAAVIVWVLPNMQEDGYGVPIRGYGVFLLLAIVSGVGLAIYRARQMGLDPEHVLSIGFWGILCGIAGARAVYVFQYWDRVVGDLDNPTLGQILLKIVSINEGGLVVYGSVFGGGAAAMIYMMRNRLPILAVCDLIAPSLVLGLALGRIGCLMNGCCFGGTCELPWSLQFPAANPPINIAASPPYSRQLGLGQLHGFRISEQDGKVVVSEVREGGPADEAGLRAGGEVIRVYGATVGDPPLKPGEPRVTPFAYAAQLIAGSRGSVRLEVQPPEGRPTEFVIPPIGDGNTLPAWSLPTHPTQLYSAINAGCLCLLMLAYYPFRRRDGEVIALLLSIYPITRFLLEDIRNDEGNFLGGLTISQNISLLLLVAAIGLWVYVFTRSRGLALPPADAKAPPAAA